MVHSYLQIYPEHFKHFVSDANYEMQRKIGSESSQKVPDKILYEKMTKSYVPTITYASVITYA